MRTPKDSRLGLLFGRSRTAGLLAAMALFLLSALASGIAAADLSGAKDHPLLKRFGGSEIIAYEAKTFDAYELQTSTFKRYNLGTKQREFANPPLKVEGGLTRIWYEAPGATSTELLRNYQNDLRSRGFQILYDSTRDTAATNWVNYPAPYADSKIATNRSFYVFFSADPAGVRVSSAKLSRPEGDVYVSLAAVEWPKDEGAYQAKRGAYIDVAVIEVKPMVQNMVLVKAEEMSRAISAAGRVALYGIYFDTNKAVLKPESKLTLDEITKLLKAEPQLKLLVVGHTDNVGTYDFNLNLSRQRAEAVVAALVQDHGAAAGRLEPRGVAYLSPLAANTTEEGRAKNRRVELVPQAAGQSR